MKKIVLLLLVVAMLFSLMSCKKGLSVDDFDKKVTIEKSVIYNENDITITAEKIEYNNYNVSLVVKLENKSEEDFEILSGATGYSVNSVNGYMISDGYLNCELKAGETVTEEIDFGYENLLTLGFTEIADIEIGFSLKGAKSGYIYTGPLTVKTSASELYDHKESAYQKCMKNGALEKMLDCSVDYFATDDFYENSLARILSMAVMSTEENTVLCVEVENLSNKQIYVRIEDMCINGVLVSESATFSENINPHKKHILSVSFSSLLHNYEKDFSKIETMKEIEILFGVAEDSWYNSKNPTKIKVSVDNIKLPDTISK